MAYLQNRDFFLEVERGNVPGWSHVYKFGKMFSLTTTLTPITSSGTYQTPTTAQSLEIVSSNANDTSAGTGARTDIGFMFKTSASTANVSVAFDIYLKEV